MREGKEEELKKKHKTKTLSAFLVFLAVSLHPTLESTGRKGRRKEKIPPAPVIATGLPEGWHLSAHKVFFFCSPSRAHRDARARDLLHRETNESKED